LLVVLVAVAVASPVGSALYGRASGIVNGSDPSAQYRAAVDRASIRIWKIAPATGIGIGDTRRLLPFVYQGTYAANPAGNDSNGYLSLLGETGVIGVVAALLVLATFVWPSTRPARFATVTQLNVIGVSVSFLVAGSFLLPTLWFWGGLRLATVRSEPGNDLFDEAVTRAKRFPRLRARRAVLAALALAAFAALSYGFSVQNSHASSLRAVSKYGIAEVTTAPHPGDARRARVDQKAWKRRFCGSNCTSSLRYIGGRIWAIGARWPTGEGCLVLDLASFGLTARGSGGVTSGFTGLSTCPFGAG
jgi:hypothetical protein